MRFCSKCGKKAGKENAFCSECGSKLPKKEIGVGTTTAEEKSEIGTKSKPETLITTIRNAILVVVSVTAGLTICGIIFFAALLVLSKALAPPMSQPNGVHNYTAWQPATASPKNTTTCTGSAPDPYCVGNYSHYNARCQNGGWVSDTRYCQYGCSKGACSQLSCPTSCDDNNSCTLDMCNLSAADGCSHIGLDGPAETCQGYVGNCTNRTCASGKCTSINITKKRCKSKYDCSDNDTSTFDTCVSLDACTAVCNHSQIKMCFNGDGYCPAGCNARSDLDCPLYQFGTTANAGNITIKLVNYEFVHCITEYTYIADEDYGYYLKLDFELTNNGAMSKYVSAGDFEVIDRYGNEYESDSFVWGGICNDADEFWGTLVRTREKIDGQLWYPMGKNPKYVYGQFYLIYTQDENQVLYTGSINP